MTRLATRILHGLRVVELPAVLDAIGQRIGEVRAARGLTQAALAERLGTSTQNYQRVELGEANVTIKTLLRIANALDVKLEAFFRRPRTVRRRGPGRPRTR